MKRLMVVLSLVLVGIVFCVGPCYAECPYTDYAPYPTIYKYVPGKTKVWEKWECVLYFSESLGSGFCFTNQVAPYASQTGMPSQRICISGDFKVVYPVD